MKTAVEIFSQLGERLALFGKDARSCDAYNSAIAENGWFTFEEICMAVEALRCEMLEPNKLREWLAHYDLSHIAQRRVAVIMAGNIPAVGFFDMMCTLVCGHRAVVKPSGKDRALILYIIELLRDIEPEIAIEICGNDSVSPSRADAVIAMGNDNTRRYFKAAFAGKPQLLRGNRHSVAILSGRESAEQLAALGRDITTYSGLGCRNVSMLFVPRGYEVQMTAAPTNPKFRNNYLQNRAMLHMQGAEFRDTGGLLLVAGEDFSTAISVLTVREYDSEEEVREWLEKHDDEVQCVVSESVEHPRQVPFGKTQHPQLTDYPDNCDVIEFLSTIG